MGLADIARHVIGCHLPQDTRAQSALDDEASNILQALNYGCQLLSAVAFLHTLNLVHTVGRCRLTL